MNGYRVMSSLATGVRPLGNLHICERLIFRWFLALFPHSTTWPLSARFRSPVSKNERIIKRIPACPEEASELRVRFCLHLSKRCRKCQARPLVEGTAYYCGMVCCCPDTKLADALDFE